MHDTWHALLRYLPPLSSPPLLGLARSLTRSRIARSANVSPPWHAAPSSANHRGLPTARRRSAHFRLVGVAPRAHPKPLSHTRRYTRRVYAITPAGSRHCLHHHRHHHHHTVSPIPIPPSSLPTTAITVATTTVRTAAVVITTTTTTTTTTTLPSPSSLSTTTTTTMIGQQRRMVTSPVLPTRLSQPCKTGATSEHAECRKPLRASLYNTFRHIGADVHRATQRALLYRGDLDRCRDKLLFKICRTILEFSSAVCFQIALGANSALGCWLPSRRSPFSSLEIDKL